MKEQIMRKIFNGFIYIHILHHAKMKPFYGTWMIEELKEHGYNISPGTLYPMLKTMVEEGLLDKEEKNVNGKIRKYYKSTNDGEYLLKELQAKLKELIREVPIEN
ncbi:PadR family transcriptional regulator [Clostridium carnis]